MAEAGLAGLGLPDEERVRQIEAEDDIIDYYELTGK
jgi:hypothetical protein